MLKLLYLFIYINFILFVKIVWLFSLKNQDYLKPKELSDTIQNINPEPTFHYVLFHKNLSFTDELYSFNLPTNLINAHNSYFFIFCCIFYTILVFSSWLTYFINSKRLYFFNNILLITFNLLGSFSCFNLKVFWSFIFLFNFFFFLLNIFIFTHNEEIKILTYSLILICLELFVVGTYVYISVLNLLYICTLLKAFCSIFIHPYTTTLFFFPFFIHFYNMYKNYPFSEKLNYVLFFFIFYSFLYFCWI